MNNLPKRKQIRLKDYDYSQNGYYFITICTKDRKNLFWETDSNPVGADIIRPKLSPCGEIAERAIHNISSHYVHICADQYVIMPDHIHLILKISNTAESGRMVSAPTTSTVVGQMKRWISREIGEPVWQKSFFEHIIRDKEDYLARLEYMQNNPLKHVIQKI